jgi:biotin-dependent carboxylase-like uncharacterized protein
VNSALEVTATGALVTLQDRGRIGYAHLGVPRAGALDGPVADLANRLVGNFADAAVLEILLGGFSATVHGGAWVAVTGAGHDFPSARYVPDGGSVSVALPATGLRSYLAVAGGFDVEPVLGSRARDTLAGLGPAPVVTGTVLRLGLPQGDPRPLDTPPPRRLADLRVDPGPHAAHFGGDPLATLTSAPYVVGPDSDRVGMRLSGAALARRAGELPSEAMLLGAIQVPPDGQPVVLLADHPTTGGYPVAGLVRPEDLWRCAQLRPGEQVGFVRGA